MIINPFRKPWKSIGTMDATAAAADGALGVTERDYNTVIALDNAVGIRPVPIGIDILEARFKIATNGHNCVMDVWGGRSNGENNIDLARICSLDVEAGSQDVVGSTTLHYADEITVTNAGTKFLRAIAHQSGNDTELMARLIIFLCGYDTIVFHGHTTFEGDCTVEYSGCSALPYSTQATS